MHRLDRRCFPEKSSFLEKTSVKNDLEQTGVRELERLHACYSRPAKCARALEADFNRKTESERSAWKRSRPNRHTRRTDEHVKKINSNIQFSQDQTVLADADAATRLPVSAGTWRSWFRSRVSVLRRRRSRWDSPWSRRTAGTIPGQSSLQSLGMREIATAATAATAAAAAAAAAVAVVVVVIVIVRRRRRRARKVHRARLEEARSRACDHRIAAHVNGESSWTTPDSAAMDMYGRSPQRESRGRKETGNVARWMDEWVDGWTDGWWRLVARRIDRRSLGRPITRSIVRERCGWNSENRPRVFRDALSSKHIRPSRRNVCLE